jgi:hypothetical protein
MPRFLSTAGRGDNPLLEQASPAAIPTSGSLAGIRPLYRRLTDCPRN